MPRGVGRVRRSNCLVMALMLWLTGRVDRIYFVWDWLVFIPIPHIVCKTKAGNLLHFSNQRLSGWERMVHDLDTICLFDGRLEIVPRRLRKTFLHRSDS